MTNDCKTCPVSTGTHKPAEALHAISEKCEVDRLSDEHHTGAWIAATSQWREEAIDVMQNQKKRIAELESQLDAIGAGGVEPLRKPAAAPQEEAIAEIVSASHDQAEFGERGINFLRDFQHLEYGTKLYPAAQAVQPAVPDGWQMVPAKPTEAMVGAIMSEGEVDAVAGLAPELRPILLERAGIAARYTAMLAAAPAHPAEGVPAQDVEIKVSAVMLKVAALIEKRVEAEPCAEAEAELLKFLRAALAATQPAPQAAMPLPLLVRDIARELGITVPQACIALKPLGNYSTNSAVTAEMARMLHDHFPVPAHPAGGVPAQASEWDGKLPERLQSVLNALRLELPAAVVNDVEFEVRSHYEAMHTSLSTSRRMYGAARDRLEAIDAAQPDPFAATQPAAQGMEALGAHGHQERSA